MEYSAVKAVHVACVAASYALFLLRGVWMLCDSPRIQRRWVRVLPHAVDTLLLASALILAWWSRQYPFAAPWLTAKVIALAVYIALGATALRPGPSRARRGGAWVAAQGVFIYIVAVALTRNPLPWAAS